MTLTTTFVNKTTLAFKLKEGDNGVYKELCVLQALPEADAQPSENSQVTLEFDARSTYKEYRVVASSRPASEGRTPAPIRMLISSDFIMDNAIIFIVPNPEPNDENPQSYLIRGELRRGSNFSLVNTLLRVFRRR